MENIFKDAYFGKPYKTAGGQKALYQYRDSTLAHLFTEGDEIDVYISDGRVDSRFFDSKNDIVSEWEEEIDEDKLQALQAKCLAEDIENGVMKRNMSHYCPNDEQSWIQGYAVGFYKAYRLTKKKT